MLVILKARERNLTKYFKNYKNPIIFRIKYKTDVYELVKFHPRTLDIHINYAPNCRSEEFLIIDEIPRVGWKLIDFHTSKFEEFNDEKWVLIKNPEGFTMYVRWSSIIYLCSNFLMDLKNMDDQKFYMNKFGYLLDENDELRSKQYLQERYSANYKHK